MIVKLRVHECVLNVVRWDAFRLLGSSKIVLAASFRSCHDE